MVSVVLPADCPFASGETRVEAQAATVRDLINALDQRFPGLGPHVDRTMAFAIDGVIHQDAWFTPLADRAVVVLIPKIGGG